MTTSSTGPLAFIGTYTQSTSEGIYVHRFDSDTGALEPVSAASGAENPSFLALHPSGRFIYATSEVEEFDGKSQGALYAYSVDAEAGELRFINRQGSVGPGPCHAIVDRSGRYVLAANYHGGSVCVLPIREDGGLDPACEFIQHEGSSVNPRRQREAHAHSINLDPQNHFAYVPDLGMDRVFIYRFDQDSGSLSPADPAFAEVNPGFGPRHFTFHPDGRWAFVNNEIGSTITGFERDPETGALTEFQTIGTLPSGFSGTNSTAHILVHPSGRFLYVSNRGHDSIAIFAVDDATGRLTAVGHQSTGGRTPRNFEIDPSGSLLVAENQNSDTVVTFRIDMESGLLTPSGSVARVPMPVCVKFLDRT